MSKVTIIMLFMREHIVKISRDQLDLHCIIFSVLFKKRIAEKIHFLIVFRHTDAIGWQVVWRSPTMLEGVTLLALNAKAFAPAAMELRNRLVAFATSENLVHLWSMREEKTSAREIGRFTLRRNANPNASTGSNSSSSSSGSSGSSTSSSSSATPQAVDDLLFVGCQLVALSRRAGRVGVWHGMTQQWQIQEVVPITSYDVAATEFLVLGCENGSIYYIGNATDCVY